MIIPDANLLLYAYHPAFKFHEKARVWWEDLAGSSTEVGLPWVSVLTFIRLSTNGHILSPPASVDEVLEIVESWLEQPNIRMLLPGERHATIFATLLRETGKASDLTNDAHLAALALEYRATLASADSDFARFPKLKWVNPVR